MRHMMNPKNFGGGDIESIYPAHTLSFLMNIQHDFRGFCRRLMEYFNENFYNKFHGGIMIIMKDDPIHLWFLQHNVRL